MCHEFIRRWSGVGRKFCLTRHNPSPPTVFIFRCCKPMYVNGIAGHYHSQCSCWACVSCVASLLHLVALCFNSAMALQPVKLSPPPWASDAVWKGLTEALCNFPSGISVLELCAGAGTASIALKLLLGQEKVCLAGAWDTDTELASIYSCVHGSDAPVHLGTSGDILATRLSSFPSAHVLVAGPPCPPFSACGNRLCLDDPRARPFERCMEVIQELSSRAGRKDHSGSPELMFFLLENVPGIGHRRAGCASTSLSTFLASLRGRLGPAWIIQHVQLNALDYGLPQSRDRVYILGRKAKYYLQYIPPIPPKFDRRVSPSELLDVSDTTPGFLTPLQAQGIQEWKDKCGQAMANPDDRGKYAFVEIGRDPTSRTVWGGSNTSAHIDRCQCLRASGPPMHVFSLGEGRGPLSMDRPLRISERCALQGFPDSLGKLILAETAGRRIFGNAMAVPVVGSLLAQELISIQDSQPASRLARMMARQVKLADLATLPCQVSSPGPQAVAAVVKEVAEYDDSEEDIVPGQGVVAVAWAANRSWHSDEGRPGRPCRPSADLSPGDHLSLAKRQRLLALGAPCQDLPQSVTPGSAGPEVSGTAEVQPEPSMQRMPPGCGSDDGLHLGDWPAALAVVEGPAEEDMPMSSLGPF